MKTRVALIFGGNSVESEVSVITAIQAYRHLDSKKYIVEPLFAYDGDFYAGNMTSIKDFAPFEPHKHKKVILYKGGFYTLSKNKLKQFFKADVVLNCCHGGEGENGVLQGVFEFNGLAHTSPAVLPSSVLMDKGVSKVLFESLLLNVAKHYVFSQSEYAQNKDEVICSIEKMGYPIIVKPARLGSSIGITPARDRNGLEEAIDVAIAFDDKVVCEVMLKDFVETNCAAYRRNGQVIVSQTEQPISKTGFLSFNDKYSSGKMSGGGHHVPAQIGDELNAKVQIITERLYNSLELDGVVRIDYLVDVNSQKIYVNEINTVPGSLAYYLFESAGISYEQLLDDIIAQTINRRLEKQAKSRRFSTGILQSYAGGTKGTKIK